MSDADLDAKFLDLADGVLPAARARSSSSSSAGRRSAAAGRRTGVSCGGGLNRASKPARPRRLGDCRRSAPARRVPDADANADSLTQLDAVSATNISSMTITARKERGRKLHGAADSERIFLQRQHRAAGIGDDHERTVPPLGRGRDNDAAAERRGTRVAKAAGSLTST